MSRKITIRGIKYPSTTDAAAAIRKCQPVTIRGVLCPSRCAAERALNLRPDMIYELVGLTPKQLTHG